MSFAPRRRLTARSAVGRNWTAATRSMAARRVRGAKKPNFLAREPLVSATCLAPMLLLTNEDGLGWQLLRLPAAPLQQPPTSFPIHLYYSVQSSLSRLRPHASVPAVAAEAAAALSFGPQPAASASKDAEIQRRGHAELLARLLPDATAASGAAELVAGYVFHTMRLPLVSLGPATTTTAHIQARIARRGGAGGIAIECGSVDGGEGLGQGATNGGTVWRGSLALARGLWEEDHHALVAGGGRGGEHGGGHPAVLELGGGRGLPSLLLGALGCGCTGRVVVSDFATTMLRETQRGIVANGLEDQVEVMRLDWDACGGGGGGGGGGSDGSDTTSASAIGAFDSIIASDVVYAHPHLRQLAETISACLRPGGRALLANNKNRLEDSGFVDLLRRAGLECRELDLVTHATGGIRDAQAASGGGKESAEGGKCGSGVAAEGASQVDVEDWSNMVLIEAVKSLPGEEAGDTDSVAAAAVAVAAEGE